MTLYTACEYDCAGQQAHAQKITTNFKEPLMSAGVRSAVVSPQSTLLFLSPLRPLRSDTCRHRSGCSNPPHFATALVVVKQAEREGHAIYDWRALINVAALTTLSGMACPNASSLSFVMADARTAATKSRVNSCASPNIPPWQHCTVSDRNDPAAMRRVNSGTTAGTMRHQAISKLRKRSAMHASTTAPIAAAVFSSAKPMYSSSSGA